VARSRGRGGHALHHRRVTVSAWGGHRWRAGRAAGRRGAAPAGGLPGRGHVVCRAPGENAVRSALAVPRPGARARGGQAAEQLVVPERAHGVVVRRCLDAEHHLAAARAVDLPARLGGGRQPRVRRRARSGRRAGRGYRGMLGAEVIRQGLRRTLVPRPKTACRRRKPPPRLAGWRPESGGGRALAGRQARRRGR
jgi:hypothetical protein